MRHAGLFGLSDHLKRLSAHGDPLEDLGGIIDFEAFRPVLVAALDYGDGAKGGRPPYDPVAMRGYLAMGGRIVDATLVAAPKQRNTAPKKEAIKAGKSVSEIWPDKPARAAQKDTDARWTLKFAKAKPLANGTPGIDIAIPSFGYKSSVSICRTFGFIRKGKVTDAARFDGRMLRDVVTNDNTASDVWAATAYRSQANEAWLKRQSRVSRIHRKKPRGKPMPERTARANAAKSKIRARVEHVFARQKDR